MADRSASNNAQIIFEIIIQGNLTDEWSDWFEGLSILHEIEDETKISGQIEDQAVLFGLLKKVRDLGLPLISVNQIMDKKSSRRKNEK